MYFSFFIYFFSVFFSSFLSPHRINEGRAIWNRARMASPRAKKFTNTLLMGTERYCEEERGEERGSREKFFADLFLSFLFLIEVLVFIP